MVGRTQTRTRRIDHVLPSHFHSRRQRRFRQDYGRARFLITYLQEKGTSPLILDLDDENHTLSRFFPEDVQSDIQPEFAQRCADRRSNLSGTRHHRGSSEGRHGAERSICWRTSTGSAVMSPNPSGLEATISRRIVMNSKRFGKRHRSQRSV